MRGIKERDKRELRERERRERDGWPTKTKNNFKMSGTTKKNKIQTDKIMNNKQL